MDLLGSDRDRVFATAGRQDPRIAHLPVVPAPPIDLDEHLRPACCTSDTITARIPLARFKQWQDFMPGTWEHADWYIGSRSTNERYNSSIKQSTNGPNLNKGTVGPRKAAPFALFAAMAIVEANRRAVESWYTKIECDGKRPTVSAAKNKRRRDAQLDEYRRSHRAS